MTTDSSVGPTTAAATIRPVSTRGWRLAGLLVAVGLVAVAWLKETAAARGREPLPHYGTLPSFALTDHEGHPISLESLRGSVWVADFILTRCAGQCPLMTQEMAKLAEEFRATPSIRLVSFTVDPEHDRPAVLAEYAKHHEDAGSRWAFVTGEQAQLWQLCREGFKLSVGEGEPTGPEPMTHSVRLVLVDREGAIRGYYDATDPARLKRLREDLKALARR